MDLDSAIIKVTAIVYAAEDNKLSILECTDKDDNSAFVLCIVLDGNLIPLAQIHDVNYFKENLTPPEGVDEVIYRVDVSNKPKINKSLN